MENNESSQGESSKLSQYVQAFSELIDRERYRRLQLLDEKIKASKAVKPSAASPRSCNLSFEMEDFFKASPSEAASRNLAKPSDGVKEDGGDNRMKTGTKRTMELSSSVQAQKQKVQKSNSSRMFVYDLNEKAESLDGIDDDDDY